MITLDRADLITQEKIGTLRTDFAIRVRAWLRECQSKGLLIYIYEGFRSLERQAELYAKGRDTPGKMVTKAKPGQSYHNHGLAIDWVPLIPRRGNECTQFDAGWDSEEIYKIAQGYSTRHGLVALPWETPHLQDGRYASWMDIPKA